MENTFKSHPQQKDFAPLFGSGDVPGYLSDGDMNTAIPFVANLLPDSGIFVEIGCFLGKSTVEWAKNFIKQDKKYRICSIDSFNSPPQVLINLLITAEFDIPDNCECQLDYFRHYTQEYDFVHPVVGFFNKSFCFPGQVAGVFEDSDHSMPYLTHALPFWWERLQPGGILSGHDYGNEVRTAVDIFAAVNGVKVHTFDRGSSMWYIKKEQTC